MELDELYAIGCDPEFFAKKDGKFVPAHKLGIPDKHNKQKIKLSENEKRYYYDAIPGLFFRDGYGIEFNTTQNFHCRALQVTQISDLVRYVRGKYGVELVASSAIEIDLADMKDAPQDVLEIGCDPAWNAYAERKMTPPLDFRTHPMRYGAGHLHFMDTGRYSAKRQWQDEAFCFNLTKWFDLYIGLPLTLMLPDKTQFLRRKWFGRAGEFRMQNHGGVYGIEYRTPGAEIFGDYRLACMGWEAGRWVINYKADEKFPKELEDDVQEIINEGPGRKIVKAFRLLRAADFIHSPEVVRYMRVQKPLKTDLSWAGGNYGTDFHKGWGEWLRSAEVPKKVYETVPTKEASY